MTSYTTQNSLLLNNLIKFYEEDDNLEVMLNIINGESPISLRIVDWFVTNYAKQKFTVYNLEEGRRFKVYNDYKLKLKAYSKKRFDPFCRRDRLLFKINETESVETTIGQLNFFKWAISNLVVDYIELYKDEIEHDMNMSLKLMKENSDKKDGSRKKRQELSLSATRGLKMNHVEIELSFD
jgi:hypothetical protein